MTSPVKHAPVFSPAKNIGVLQPSFDGIPPMGMEAYTRAYATGLTVGTIAAQYLLAEKQHQIVHRLETEVYTDSKTGLLNSRGLEGIYADWVARMKVFSVAFIDLDRFGDLNSRYGHLKVDRLLSDIGRHMETELRDDDILGRQGGDEFVVLVPNADVEQATIILERVAQSVKNITTFNGERLPEPLTMSIGVVASDPHKPYSDIANQAARLMYEAKQEGGNGILLQG